MSEPTPGATETDTEQSALTDEHAQALLADAIKTAETENAEPADGDTAALRAEIAKLRRENASSRVVAKQNAADEARTQLAQQIGKALGLVQDDEPADPAKLTEQLTAAGLEARQAKVALAVYRAADGANGDPVALLDSASFLAKAALLDPADPAAISAAITEAVTANPRLGKTEPQGMKRNPAQGASASPPLGVNERIAAAEKAGDIKTAIRLKAGMALNTNQ